MNKQRKLITLRCNHPNESKLTACIFAKRQLLGTITQRMARDEIGAIYCAYCWASSDTYWKLAACVYNVFLR